MLKLPGTALAVLALLSCARPQPSTDTVFVSNNFAARSKVPLRLEPVTPWMADMQWPMQFDISGGVQKDDQKLLKQIDAVLERRKPEIAKLLKAYNVPTVQER